MNKKAKIIIAVLILIFLGLIIFAFASPKDDGEGDLDNRVKQGEVDKKPSKDTDKESEDEKKGKEETETTKKEETPAKEEKKDEESKEETDPTYENALAAVEKAEKELTEEAVEAAKEAIAEVTEGIDTTELEERVAKVESDIAAKDLVDALAELVNNAENKADIDEARKFNTDNKVEEAVAAVNNAELKAELEEALKDILVVLNDTKAPEVGIEDGTIAQSVAIDVKDETTVTLTLTKDNKLVLVANPSTITEDGIYTLTVVDEAFNEVTVTFTVDNVKPVITLNGNAEMTVERTHEYTELNATAEDNVDTFEDAITPSKIELDGEEVDAIDTNVAGTYVVYFDVADTAGNAADTVTRTVIVEDTTKPTVTIDVVTVKNKKASTATFTLTADEDIQDVEGWTRIDSKTLELVVTGKWSEVKKAAGTVEVKDLYDNATEVNYIAEDFDLNVEVTNEPAGDVSNAPVTVTISLAQAGKYKDRVLVAPTDTNWALNNKGTKITRTFNESANGSLVVYDNYGHSTEAEYNVVIDMDAPIASITTSEYDANTNTYKVVITAEEAINLLEGWEYVDEATKLAITKTYTDNLPATNLVVTDLAGNESDPMALEITAIDKTAPTVESVEYFVGDSDVATTDAILTKETVKVVITANEDLTLPENWSYVDEANKAVIYRVYDVEMTNDSVTLADKYNNAAATDLTFTIDRTVPEIQLNGAAAAEKYTEAVTPTTEEGATLTVKKGDADYTLVEGKITENGTYTVTAVDAAGNSSSVTFEVAIPAPVVKPEITSASYTINNDKNSKITITVNATEGTKTEYSIDGKTWNEFTSGIEIVGNSNNCFKNKTIYVRAVDKTNAENISDVVTATKSN